MIGNHHSDSRQGGAEAAADRRGALEEIRLLRHIIEGDVMRAGFDRDGDPIFLRGFNQRERFDRGQVDDVDTRTSFLCEPDHHDDGIAFGLGRASG